MGLRLTWELSPPYFGCGDLTQPHVPAHSQEVLKWPLFYRGRGDPYEYSPNPERAVDDYRE